MVDGVCEYHYSFFAHVAVNTFHMICFEQTNEKENCLEEIL